jgi:hypothetical protein
MTLLFLDLSKNDIIFCICICSIVQLYGHQSNKWRGKQG